MIQPTAALLNLVKVLADYEESARGSSVVDIIALQPTPAKARPSPTLMPRLCDYCTDSVQSTVNSTVASLKAEVKSDSIARFR